MIIIKIIEIILASIALASDAFSIAICKGLSIKKLTLKKCMIVGLWFGIFQGIMTLLGYIFKISFNLNIIKFDQFISFFLLMYLGIKMIFSIKNENDLDNKLDFKSMLVLSLATSIDAFAYGIAYACNYKYNVNIYIFLTIGVITFILSVLGCIIGNKIGHRYEKTSLILGGVLLILMAFKALFSAF